MNRTRTLATLVMAVVAVALASCGGDGDSTDTTPATDLEVRMDSFSFDPADTTVVADADIEVTALNLDSNLEHTWVVVAPGNEISTEDDVDEGDILFELRADQQRSAVGTLSLPAGEYQVICTIPGHFAAGMKGTVTAVAGSGT